MRIEVGIGTLGRWENLAVVLGCLLSQTFKDWDLTIIDDSPDPRVDIRTRSVFDNLLKLLEEKGHRWKVLIGKRKGPQFVHSLITANSENPLTWKIDDDLYFDPKIMKILHNVFADKKVGCVGSLAFIPGSKRNFLPESWKSIKEFNGKVFTGSNIMGVGYGCAQHYVIHKDPKPKEVEHLAGAIMFRTEIGQKFGWNLNLSRLGHTSETEFTYRFFKAGYKCLLVPETVVYHFLTPDALSHRRKETDELRKQDLSQFFDHVRQWALGAGAYPRKDSGGEG
jgi:hypothetical protein